jgi:beta-fructofuranosidase
MKLEPQTCRPLPAKGNLQHSMFGAFRLFLGLALILGPNCSRCETAEEALIRATTALTAATPRAQADPTRPIFHVAAPAQWMNDPNGPIFHKGYYHLFYQLHPYSDNDGTKYWGHVRSRDLVKWEPLPIALAPTNDKGEEAIWSGCCTINGLGEPMIFYTSIARGKSAFDHAEQWAATSDDDLIYWKKSALNPVLSETLHGSTKIYDWRDPFVVHQGRRTFLVAGGHLAKQGLAAVNIYEAQNPELTQWQYRGVLFQIPDAPTAECPNFFSLGKQWVLFVSPYGKVQYFIGDFDEKTCRFTPRTQGFLDYGPNFYAPNTMLLGNGDRLVWGWVNGFPGGHGWNGCLSVPRRLSITRDGQLREVPAPQLNRLHGEAVSFRNRPLLDRAEILALPPTNTLEILADIDMGQATALGFELRPQAGGGKPVAIGFDSQGLVVDGTKAPLSSAVDRRKVRLRIFVDRSVLEVLVNETVWVTKTIVPLGSNPVLSARSDGGPATLKRVRAWPMTSIW